MIRSLRWLGLALVVAALTAVGNPCRAEAAPKVYNLTSYSTLTLYDADGNTLGLRLDVESRERSAVVIGVMVTLNGIDMGYAPPVLSPNGSSIDHWDARGARVRIINGQYAVAAADLGPWYTHKIERPAEPPRPSVQSLR